MGSQISKTMNPLKLLIIFGGPSEESGISVNSAQTIINQLQHKTNFIKIKAIYVDPKLDWFEIEEKDLYYLWASNSPKDFEDMIEKHNVANEDKRLEILRSCDLIWPVIHGLYGEDGEFAGYLEKHNLRFIGSPSSCMKTIYSKSKTYETLKNDKELQENPFLMTDNFEYCSITDPLNSITEAIRCAQELIEKFGQCVVKMDYGGSSLGVEIVDTVKKVPETLKLVEEKHGVGKRQLLKSTDRHKDSAMIIEPVRTGTEFSITVINGKAFPPIEKTHPYQTARKHSSNEKYCPDNRISRSVLTGPIADEIKRCAERLFSKYEFCDYARFDGWITNNKFTFSDINIIPGLDLKSCFFQTAALAGWRYDTVLLKIIANALRRHGQTEQANFIESQTQNTQGQNNRSKVFILCGGETSERQVSLLTGTHMYSQLIHSKDYEPILYFLDMKNTNKSEKNVRRLSDFAMLFSNVENVQSFIKNQKEIIRSIQKSNNGCQEINANSIRCGDRLTFTEFLSESKKANALILNGLHGGFGEGGELQEILAKEKIVFTGSKHFSSKKCMKKLKSQKHVKNFISEKKTMEIEVIPSKLLKWSHLKELSSCTNKKANQDKFEELLNSLKAKWYNKNVQYLLMKPNSDGSSIGVVPISNGEELRIYAEARINQSKVKKGKFELHQSSIEMPVDSACYKYNNKDDNKFYDTIVQLFVETTPANPSPDLEIHPAALENNPTKLNSPKVYEMTCGVVKSEGKYHSFIPSICLPSQKILSYRNKFKAGFSTLYTLTKERTERNDLPFKIDKVAVSKIRNAVETLAGLFQIEDYARLDFFWDETNQKMIFLEFNTLPALTPSTAILQQAAMNDEDFRLKPLDLIHLILEEAKKKKDSEEFRS